MYNKKTYAVSGSFFMFIDSIAKKKRIEMVRAVTDPNFALKLNMEEISTILDVGTTSDERLQSSNIILRTLAADKEVTVLSDQSPEGLKMIGFNFSNWIIGDITQPIFFEKTFELVICSATLEHVGNFSSKIQAIENLISLSEGYILITIPNRWYPVELHSKIPLVHWLPNSIWRAIYRKMGQEELSQLQNLDFISRKQILRVIKSYSPKSKVRVAKIRTFGFISNYVFLVEV
jgi:hypothetical protein